MQATKSPSTRFTDWRIPTVIARAHPHRMRIETLAILVLIAAGIAVGTTWISASTGSLALYGDARAHLDVARRVSDAITPGLTQLGSVWLPLPHLLLAPLVAFDPLWHTAIAGAIVGGGCFVYSAFRIFGLAEQWLGDRRCAWLAFGVYVTNVNLDYLQSTALTEPVLLAFLVGATFHFSRWTSTRAHRDLAWAAAMVFCATLTRYDGWALLAASGLAVILWSRRVERREHGVEANVLLFGAIATYGIVLWILYNLVIFHDPLYFLHSSFSAQSQQQALQQVGALGTHGSIVESVRTYFYAVVDVVGWVPLALSAVGVAMVLGRRKDRARNALILLMLAAPVAFNVISLWGGQSTIRVPERPPFQMWNIRYGLVALPLVALSIGALARIRWRPAIPLIAAGTVVTAVAMAAATPITVLDGRTGVSSATGGSSEVVATHLRDAYRGGRVLADDGSTSPVMFASGLRLDQFVTIGFHPYYEDALRDPESNVAWAVVVDGDAIADDMSQHPERFQSFHLVAQQGRIRLYERAAPE